MQENRSFDHYFGTLSGVRGFCDPAAPVRRRAGLPGLRPVRLPAGKGAAASGYLQPFRLLSDPPLEDGQTTNDIEHSWATQHRSWNGGAMDSFVSAHLAADGAGNGPVTMGYYTRQDLPFYYALADAFTVCDGYFCSVMGPTDPNRVMACRARSTRTGRPAGQWSRPTATGSREYGKLGWETMPERLKAAGISWKVYNDRLSELALSPLPYFKAFNDPFSVTGAELVGRGLTPDSLDDFTADVPWAAARGVVDHAAAGAVRAPRRAARVRRGPDPRRAGTRWCPTQRCGRRPSCSSSHDENGGSSTTCRR